MTDLERLWHLVADTEIAAKDAEADLQLAFARARETRAQHLDALLQYRDAVDAKRRDFDGD